MRLPVALLATSILGLASACTLYVGPDSDDGAGESPGDGAGFRCADDADCAAGCYCDLAGPDLGGVCVEAGFCASDEECPEGYRCDVRSSCVPDEEPEPEPEPVPTCEEIADEADCLAREDCAATYTGIGCESPDGSSCTEGMSDCTCESFVFAGCGPVATPPPGDGDEAPGA